MKLDMCKQLSMMVLAGALWLGIAPLSEAQAQPYERKLKQHLVSPDQLLDHAEELELTQDQRLKIRDAMKASSSKLIDLRFELKAESEALEKLLEVDALDDKKISTQADKVLKAEGALKKETLMMMVKVRQVLTPAQIAKVKAYQAKQRERKAQQRQQQKDKQRPKRKSQPVF